MQFSGTKIVEKSLAVLHKHTFDIPDTYFFNRNILFAIVLYLRYAFKTEDYDIFSKKIFLLVFRSNECFSAIQILVFSSKLKHAQKAV